MPDQLPTTRVRQVARRNSCEARLSSTLMRKVTTKFHRKRTAITAAHTAAA
jgi:hypothetical protein